MAKLSARGRTELYRLSKTITEQAGTADQYESTRYYAIMSDGHILRKTCWRNSIGKLESTPWNDLCRCPNVQAYLATLKTAGYSLVDKS